MKAKAKITISAILAILLIVLAAISIIAVLAATSQQVTSQIRVSYKAMEVIGQASARWKVGSENWQDMKTGGDADGKTIINFDLETNDNFNLSPTDKEIKLSVQNNFVVFEYKFTNSGGNEYAIDLFYTDDEQKDENISVFCISSDEEITDNFKENINTSYGDWATTTIAPNGGTKYVYILASVTQRPLDAHYSGQFQFNLDGQDYSDAVEIDGTGAITGVKDNNLSVIRIPSEINGTPVTKISQNAIVDNTALTELIIPDSVTEIEQGALNSGCTSLKYISVPFVGKTATSEIEAETCFGYIFGASSSSDQNSSLPTSLTNVVVTSGTSIGERAFSGCSGLISVTIPQGVTSIGDYAFVECSGLTGSLTIPSSVESIGQYAFAGCRGLTGPLNIPDSVTSIENNVFYNCRGLTGPLNIPDGVTSIGSQAFWYCSGLTGPLTIPQGVTSIGNNAFCDCSGLTTVTIPGSVESIGSNAFSSCSGLTGSLTIPQGVTSIGSSAFSICSGLTSITIPESVTSIGEMPFYSCSGLTSIQVDSQNEYYTSRDKEGKECNIILSLQGKTRGTLIAGCNNSTIPDDDRITRIGEDAFRDCSGLTSITIPHGLPYIEKNAFYGCSGLTEVTIENSNVYKNADTSSFGGVLSFGGLFTYATTVRVLTNLVYSNHAYLNSTNFPTITTESVGGKDYTVYKK